MKFIYQVNTKSIQESKKILQKNKDLYNKYLFIFQFKMLNQYNVWKKIFEENFADDNNLKHFGIGGLVGLRGITGIKFSPFIAMVYKCLNLIYNRNLNETSIVHILGIYGLHDRVALSFLQKLINNYYLKDRNCKIQLTYDTVNYSLSGLYKLRELEVYIPDNGKYITGFAHNLAHEMHKIISDEEVLKIILKDLDNINKGNQVEDTHVASLLNVITQTMIDRIINEELDKEGFVETFVECGNFNKFKNKISPILKNLEIKYPTIFGNRTSKNLLNFQYCSAFDSWFNNGKELEKLENLVEKFVSLINFPVDLMDK